MTLRAWYPTVQCIQSYGVKFCDIKAKDSDGLEVGSYLNNHFVWLRCGQTKWKRLDPYGREEESSGR